MKKIAITLLSLSLISASLTACEKVPQSTDVAAVSTTVPGGAQQKPEFSASDFTYEEVADGLRITQYLGSDTSIVIPESIDGKPVVELSVHVFFNWERYEFLKSVESITSLSIKRVDPSAFYHVKNLKEFQMPMLESIPDALFENFTNLEILDLSSVKHIGARAFYNCSITELYLPSVTSMDERALMGSFVKIIHGKSGSYLETWVKARPLCFVDMDDPDGVNPDRLYFFDFNLYKSSGIAYAYENKRLYLRIDAWDDVICLPENMQFGKNLSERNFVAAVNGDTGMFVAVLGGTQNATSRLHMIRFTRGSDRFEQYSVALNMNFNAQELFFNFTDSQNGFLFLFEKPRNSYSSRNRYLVMHTRDGGKTWEMIRCPDPPYFSMVDVPVVAKFATDQVGLFSFRYVNDADVCYRTYLTVDGGMTWDFLSCLPDPLEGYSQGSAEVVDFSCQDSVYWLEVQVYSGNQIDTLRYCSSDLILWSRETDLPDGSQSANTNSYGVTEQTMFRYRSVIPREEALYGHDTCHAGEGFGSFTCVDLDGDGLKEILIRSLDAVVIWHRVDSDVYVYTVPKEDLCAVDSNGVCYWRTENSSGAYRLSFTGTDYRRTELYCVANAGTEQEVYRIGDAVASREAFQAYLESLDGEVLHWYHRFCGHPYIDGKPWYGK